MVLLVTSAFLVPSSCEALTSSGASLDRLAKISNKYFDWYPAILLFHSDSKNSRRSLQTSRAFKKISSVYHEVIENGSCITKTWDFVRSEFDLILGSYSVWRTKAQNYCYAVLISVQNFSNSREGLRESPTGPWGKQGSILLSNLVSYGNVSTVPQLT